MSQSAEIRVAVLSMTPQQAESQGGIPLGFGLLLFCLFVCLLTLSSLKTKNAIAKCEIIPVAQSFIA